MLVRRVTGRLSTPLSPSTMWYVPLLLLCPHPLLLYPPTRPPTHPIKSSSSFEPPQPPPSNPITHPPTHSIQARVLHSLGYQRHGNETLMSGMTGRQLTAKIFIGPTFYQRLKHLVRPTYPPTHRVQHLIKPEKQTIHPPTHPPSQHRWTIRFIPVRVGLLPCLPVSLWKEERGMGGCAWGKWNGIVSSPTALLRSFETASSSTPIPIGYVSHPPIYLFI